MAKKDPEPPTDFDWVSLAQPTSGEPDNWKPVTDAKQGEGPWRVRDKKSGLDYSTYVLVEGMTVLNESPFDRSGDLRAPNPGVTDTAPAE